MNWVKWAVCVGFEWHTSDDAHHWEQAKLVCADCPVARTCAEAGMGGNSGYRYCGDRCRRARRDVDDARRRHLLRLRDVFGAGDDVPVAVAGGGVGLTGGLDQKAAS